ncbi:DUF2793 domain-containing protein [Sphingopyxis sp. H115]|uniref:DUF2793 domain-containing protein n=1 Tax=Sphingopyxis sp. H115 TaxID=1759073 RepID=UPI000736F672|nr:DUF2793 domain-containing protein [Sphingopyxis sp. H115]KTD99686.1 hypothetical protein ATE71_21465 [Sphingopyxis sp. H115]
MTDMLATPRLALPLLAVAQAQKEVTHNEALVLLDALVHAAVLDGPLADPPADPAEGQCWIVGADPTGAWSGQAMAIACWSAGGWRFAAPRAGMRVTRLADGARLRFDDSSWTGPGTIAAPAGGSTIDSEARSVIGALILQLEAQGLLISG